LVLLDDMIYSLVYKG